MGSDVMPKGAKLAVTKLVRSPWKDGAGDAGVWRLCTPDQTSVAIATTRSMFWPAHMDFNVLERALVLTLEDLPFLAGRVAPLKLPIGWKMGDIAVALTNAGAELSLVEASELTLADFGPDSWPMRGVTISAPPTPPYLPSMDTAKALLAGQEPLCKVRLTTLKDGSILGITLSHTITDGMHWPALLTHIAARYRQAGGGKAARAEELLAADLGKDALTVAALRKLLPGCANWEPEPFVIKPSLGDYWRAAGLLFANASKKVNFEILHLPRARLAQLKTAVLEGCAVREVTSGDVVQALAALMVHAAEGKPLLPVRPKCMVALVQIPGAPASYLGNAVHPMAVGLSEPVAEEGDLLGTLRALAAQIRTCTADIRTSPAKALQALYESEQACASPVLRSLAYLAGHRLPFVTCTTNFIGPLPADAALDFGLGASQVATRHLTTPLAASMAVVRPAAAPYGEGLFIQVSLTPAQGRRLRKHLLLAQLAPDAKFLGPAEEGRSSSFSRRLWIGPSVHSSSCST